MNFIGLVLLFCLPGQVNAHDAFFAGPIPELRFVIAPAEEASLRREPRKYVRAQFIENQGKSVEVGIKIKGAAGSTRPYDDKPALTINMDRYHREQSFHGMDKFHLNNSVQDETYLHEKIGFALSNAAKVPASRVTHARVRINNRDLGLFVLKEGFDTTFLKNYYPDNKGNLYDGGFLQDIDANLQLDIGPGPEDQRDLKALLAACREGDLVKRKIAVEKVLNVDEMISFMAVELMSGHWDGYARNRNNYRIYFDPRSQKAIFLPHGMDQLFADFSAMEVPGAIVAAAVMSDPQSRRLYRRRVEALLPLFEPKAMELVIDPVLKRLKPVVDSLGKDFANQHAQAVNGLRERIKGRYLALVESVKRRDPGPIVFGPEGFEPIRDWLPQPEQGQPKYVETDQGGRKILSMTAPANAPTVASWRSQATLAKGNYRLEVRMKTEGIVAQMDLKGAGADLRISGEKVRPGLAGNTDWTVRTMDFEVKEAAKDVILVCEMRCKGGTLHMDPEARIVRK